MVGFTDFLLTYEYLRSNFFVYGGETSQTYRRRAGNPDCAVEPRADHGARGPRSHQRAQAHAVHHRAQDAADHGGEGPGAARREAARAHLQGRAAAGMDAAATCGRPAAAGLQRHRRAACCWVRFRPERHRRRNSPSCTACSKNTKRGHDDSLENWVHYPRRLGAGLDAGALAVGRRAGGAAAGCGTSGAAVVARPLYRRVRRRCSRCSPDSASPFQLVLAGQRIQGGPAQSGAIRQCRRWCSATESIVGNGFAVLTRRTICRGSRPLDRRRALLPCCAGWRAGWPRGACAAGESVRLPKSGSRCWIASAARLRLSAAGRAAGIVPGGSAGGDRLCAPGDPDAGGLLAGLPAGQIESILLHELAHIRRHDYLVNLLQIVVESLVFYHPAVWWISGVMRAERENCCDDLAVATQGDAFGYAAALTALEQNRGTVRDAVLAATGGSLVKRMRRLLTQPEGPRAALTPVFSAAALPLPPRQPWQHGNPLRRRRAPGASAPAPVQLLAQAQETPLRTTVDTPYSSGLPRTWPTSSPMTNVTHSRACSPMRSANISSNSSGNAATRLPAPWKTK